jgi:hypothetical protein
MSNPAGPQPKIDDLGSAMTPKPSDMKKAVEGKGDMVSVEINGAVFKTIADDAWTNAPDVQEAFIWKFALSCLVLSFVCNTLWLMFSNEHSCLTGMQNFYFYIAFFEGYFMLLKGTMISLYYYVFMPLPERPYGMGHHLIHGALAFSFPAMSIVLSLIWKATGLVEEGDPATGEAGGDTWAIIKLNLPMGASGALVAWMPFYILFMWKQNRFFAFKRYIILTVILVGDLFFIATSHVYVYYFFEYQRDPATATLSQDSPVTAGLIEMGWIFGFTLLYMKLLGKIWEFAVFMMHYVAPMEDYQHQRLVFFATVILDMHRIMYSREIFTGLKTFVMFYIILVYYFSYDFYQFGIKSWTSWQALIMMMWLPHDQQTEVHLSTKPWVNKLLKVFKVYSDILEWPKRLLVIFHWDIDAGGDPGHSKTVTFFNCDNMIFIKNAPSCLVGGNEEKSAAWWKKAPEKTEGGLAVEGGKNSKRDQTLMEDTMGEEDLKAAAAQKSEFAPLCDPWRIKFYESLSIRISGIIFTRYRVRSTIKMISALCFLWTSLLVRQTGSKEVLNTVLDHSTETDGPLGMPTKLWIYGMSFFVFDIVEIYMVTRFQLADPKRKRYNLRRFGRLLQDWPMYLMIISCHVCCNSDVFLIFPTLSFCPF